MKVDWLFIGDVPPLENGVFVTRSASGAQNQNHTNDAFSDKWTKMDQSLDDESDPFKAMQFKWYFTLYGHGDEGGLRVFLRDKKVILDAGCGLGYKAAGFARLNPDAIVVAMDFSDAIHVARARYGHLPNLVFVKGDIADTSFADGVFDFVSCDQVLHHTESPPATLREFARISNPGAVLNTYVYARKALPRELLDEYFREYSKRLSRDQIWALSEQLTALGRTLSELDSRISVPDMPALRIKGGEYDLQRFIYWNFIKCFWNPEWGREASVSTNFDWYSPSNAFRYTRDEFVAMCRDAGFEPEYVHEEEACHSGRFVKCAE